MPDRFPLDNQENNLTQDVSDQTEPDVELLVAYLDGEMDTQGVRQVEDRLSVEPDLREKMASLEQTWNMLGELESVPVDKELVRSTMEVVTLTIEKELGDDEKKVEQRKLYDRLILAAILIMFGVIGYQLAALVGVHVQNQLVDDVPIIRQINDYKEIGSFEFLKALSEKDVFDPPTVEDTALQEILQNQLSTGDDSVTNATITSSDVSETSNDGRERP